MNIIHLKYAVEVAKTQSITKAAENLYMAQPNLSRAIKELEDGLGVKLFKRTSKGITPTVSGEEFLGYAKKILNQVDTVEAMFRENGANKNRFSISVPRASYISCAFTEFVNQISCKDNLEVFYKETNSMRAINNITNADYNLGIIRYQTQYDRYFNDLLAERELVGERVCEFHYVALMSKKHKLAEKANIRLSDLSPYIEIAHADPYVPSIPLSTVQKEEWSENVDKRVFVFERGSQMDLLSQCDKTFMWVSPVPQRLLDEFGLIEKDCPDNDKIYRDVLVYRKGYKFSPFDKLFVSELMKFRKALS